MKTRVMDLINVLLVLVLIIGVCYSESMDYSCNADEQNVELVLHNHKRLNISGLNLLVRTINKGSEWIQQPNCTSPSEDRIVCPSHMARNAQYLKFVAHKTNNMNISELIWYYNCFPEHGAYELNLTSNTKQGFTMTWKQHTWDEKFLKLEKVVINEISGSKSATIENNINPLNFTNVNAGTKYRVCVHTEFTGPINFLKIDKQLVVKCLEIQTPGKPVTPKKEKETSSLKTPLLAVGIGLGLLIILFIIFIVYNKKCKQVGDHDYDMNRVEAGDENDTDIKLTEKNEEQKALTSAEGVTDD